MKDRSNDPSHHEQKLLPGSYISLRYLMDYNLNMLSSGYACCGWYYHI